MSNANDPAFPSDNAMPRHPGLTKREHAAILLRVPKSGDDEIDAMIREANRRDAAAMAMQGLLACDGEHCFTGAATFKESCKERAQVAISFADALLAELERTA